MEQSTHGFRRAGLPLSPTVARLLCKELMLQVEYLQLENQILRSKIPGKIRLTEDERRSLPPWPWARSSSASSPTS